MISKFEVNKIRLMMPLNPKSEKFNRLKSTLSFEAFILLTLNMDYIKFKVMKKRFTPTLHAILEELI